MSSTTFGERLPGQVAGFAVSSVAVASRVAAGISKVAQQLYGTGLSQLCDGDSVSTVGGGINVREGGNDAVPAQQLEEAPLPCFVGCVADSV